MKILCPTDFSKHSKIALEYAVHISNDLAAELHILSVYNVPRQAASFVSLDDQIKSNTEEDMAQLVASITPLMTGDRLPVVHIHKGAAADIILKYGARHEIDLIVMGTQGSNSLRTLLMGSVTRKVANKSKIPVLAIPQVIAHQLSNNKILLALDDQPLEHEEAFAVPRALAQQLDLLIDIVHVDKEEKVLPFDPFVATYLGDRLGEVILLKGDDPVKVIKEYADQHNFGMVIMVRREKSFLQKLLTVGNTSEEIARTNIPLLMVPDLGKDDV